MPSFVLVLVSLWAPMAYGLGASYIVQYEMQQLGLQWSNVAMTAVRLEGGGEGGREGGRGEGGREGGGG